MCDELPHLCIVTEYLALGDLHRLMRVCTHPKCLMGKLTPVKEGSIIFKHQASACSGSSSWHVTSALGKCSPLCTDLNCCLVHLCLWEETLQDLAARNILVTQVNGEYQAKVTGNLSLLGN